MAVVIPTLQKFGSNSWALAQWENASTGDIINDIDLISYDVPALLASVQLSGTLGGATVTLRASNDGANFEVIKDVSGVDIIFTSAGLVEFGTSARHIDFSITGGTGDNVTLSICMPISAEFR